MADSPASSASSTSPLLSPSTTASAANMDDETSSDHRPTSPSASRSNNNNNNNDNNNNNHDDDARPCTPRTQTEPSMEPLTSHHTRPRNRSPYSHAHFRSRSGSGSPGAPPMMRAHSLPTVINPSGHLSLSPSPLPTARPSSPLRSPKRTRSPFRLADESYAHSGAPRVCDISEDAELDLTPRPASSVPTTTPFHPSPLGSVYSSTGSLSRTARRRPASPLHHASVPFGGAAAPPITPTSAPSSSNSPLLSSAKFNEPFPGLNAHYPSSLASSSVPSTPTSMRSRSPSISSLETIPDTPDAEAEAVEADRLARLKAALERGNGSDDGNRRSSLDVPGERRAFNFGRRDSRKRWSVCGAERRQDLDLETIWED